MKKVLIINGPNLNLLGSREPHLYGNLTLDEIKLWTEQQCKSFQIPVDIQWYQSNIEGELINTIQSIQNHFDLLIINPAGYSHTSVAIFDALKMVTIPVIEVHLTQVYQREQFRQTLLTAKAAMGIMTGFGKNSYFLAIASQYLI